VKQESTSQIITLVEALASAKKEIDIQSARMRDLEEMLQKEREARETAEELAKRLEQQSMESKMNGSAKHGTEGSIIEEAFDPQLEVAETKENELPASFAGKTASVDPKAIKASTLLLQQRLESMLVDMQDMRQDMDTFRKRAELAEFERNESRKTLAEMVGNIRSEEQARRSSSTERARSPAVHHLPQQSPLNDKSEVISSSLAPLFQKDGPGHDNAFSSAKETKPQLAATGTLSRPSSYNPLLYHSTPYASMLGVVLLGMGLMAYMNGWQPPKVEH
jgi:hypothetical protein